MDTQYEIINKVTHEIFPVTVLEFGQDYVNVSMETESTKSIIRFENPGQVGQLTNEDYLIRQVGTHLEADGVGTVELPEETA